MTNFLLKQTDDFLPMFAKSFTEVGKLSVDLIDAFINSDITNPILKQIPIIKTGITLYETGISIHDRFLYEKTLRFLWSLNSGNATKDEIKDYQEDILKSPKKLKKEIGRVSLILDKMIEIEKAHILGVLHSNFVAQKINWDKYCELSCVLDVIFLSDIKRLYDIRNIKEPFRCNTEYQRLLSYGLLSNQIPMTVDDMDSWNPRVTISDIGKDLIEYGLNEGVIAFCKEVFI